MNCNFVPLQNSLDHMSTWTTLWQLELAPAKCEHITISTNKHCVPSQFTINDLAIKHVTNVTDLGIVLTSDMKWSSHITSVVSKALCTSYHILHSFKTNNLEILLKADISFQKNRIDVTCVGPLMEYNTCVWSPHLITDIRCSVQ